MKNNRLTHTPIVEVCVFTEAFISNYTSQTSAIDNLISLVQVPNANIYYIHKVDIITCIN